MQTVTLDWIAFTAKEPNYAPEIFISKIASTGKIDTAKPTNGYTEAIAAENGILCMWNTKREEMGYHVVVSGSALRDVCERDGLSQHEVIKRCSELAWGFTRVDLAKDVQDVPIDLDGIYKTIEMGHKNGTARQCSQTHSPNGGNTIYIGSRTSDRFLRIYNKAAQTGTEGHWTRLEIETKGMVARALVSVLMQTSNWGSVIDDFARRMIDVRHDDYQALLTNEPCEIGFPKIEKHSDREKWIETQVYPAVIDHMMKHPDSKAIAMLYDMLTLLRGAKSD